MNFNGMTMDLCKLNECVIMTNKKLLPFVLSSKFAYEVVFKIDENIDAKEFCEKQ